MNSLCIVLATLLAIGAGQAVAETPMLRSVSTPIPPFSSYKLSPYEKQERLRVYSWGVIRQKDKDCHNVAWSALQKDSSILAVGTSKKRREPLRYRIVDTGMGQTKSVIVQTL